MKLNCLTNTKTCVSSCKEHQPNAIYCKMMEHEKWSNILQLAIPLNVSAN